MLIRAGKGATQSYHHQPGLVCLQCLVKRQKSYSASKKRCYYDVLGVAQEADQKEIRSSYVSKTKELHPDRDINDPALHDLFVELNEAYSVLGNEAKRIEYNESKNNLSRVTYSPSSSSMYNPFGSTRSGDTGVHHFNPKFQGYHGDNPYTQSMYRDFQFAQEKYRGERKGRNKFFILLAVGAMVGATGFHFLHISYFHNRWKENEDKIFQENLSTYDLVREKARLNGTRKQLQLLATNSDLSESPKGQLRDSV